MQYRIDIKDCPTLYLSPVQFDALLKAIYHHELRGYRDGETRTESVTITEVGG